MNSSLNSSLSLSPSRNGSVDTLLRQPMTTAEKVALALGVIVHLIYMLTNFVIIFKIPSLQDPVAKNEAALDMAWLGVFVFVNALFFTWVFEKLCDLQNIGRDGKARLKYCMAFASLEMVLWLILAGASSSKLGRNEPLQVFVIDLFGFIFYLWLSIPALCFCSIDKDGQWGKCDDQWMLTRNPLFKCALIACTPFRECIRFVVVLKCQKEQKGEYYIGGR
eukprot:TRINITY_DN14790_c0_g1_i1.p1 TRINITY_DN14790_c0_g1~~TRINITY_DN14790_c0_g1_i1.p1  ORF type:complete len:221 (-),score=48.37 TRINITY_DN14790_c0_g1_i1:37-699(-)